MRRAIAIAIGAMLVAPPAWAADALTYRAIDAYGRRMELGTFELARNGTPRVTTVRGVDAARLAALTATDLRLRPERIEVGERWEDRATRVDPQTGASREVRLTGRVVGTQTITTRAGTFDTVVIERRLLLGDAGRYRTETRRTEREWFAPRLGVPVRTEVWEEFSDPTVPRILQNQLTKNRELYELVSTGPAAPSAGS
jgi:hypothetical protein